MGWINRHIANTIVQRSKDRPAVLLTGARQSGKTSLLKKVFTDHNYISLELPLTAESAANNGDLLLQEHTPPIIIDEVQYAPPFLRFIKEAIDSNRSTMGRFILSGSQKFSLMQNISESLAGRITILECYPLSFLELCDHYTAEDPDELIDDFLFQGGYPEIYDRDLDIESFYADYIATYLERDVRQIVKVSNLRDFQNMMKILATQVGQLLSMNNLATEVGVSAHTIKSWINILEASNIIFLLAPYYRNLGKRIIKSPKVYFVDNGILTYLLGFKSKQSLKDSTLIGSIFENLIFSEIIKFLANKGKRADIYFYRDTQGCEVDFLIPSEEKFIPIECKWRANKDSFRNIRIFEQIVGKEKIAKKIVIGKQNKVFNLNNNENTIGPKFIERIFTD